MGIQYILLYILAIIIISYFILSNITIRKRINNAADDIWNCTYNELIQNPDNINYSDGTDNMIYDIIDTITYKYLPNDLYDNTLQLLLFGEVTRDVLYYILNIHVAEIVEIIVNNKQNL